MLVVDYMEARGVDGSLFDPDWVARLDAVKGILSVLQEIDESMRPNAEA